MVAYYFLCSVVYSIFFYMIVLIFSSSYSVYLAKNEFSRVKEFMILKSLNIACLADPSLYVSMLKVLYLNEKNSFFSDRS
jgi:hypothetical protein